MTPIRLVAPALALTLTATAALAQSTAAPGFDQAGDTPASAQTPAPAGDPRWRQTITVSADTQRLTDGYGSLSTARLEYKVEDHDTTVVITPRVGRRDTSFRDETAIGGEATLYQRWTPGFSTRTSLFVAEDNSVFAHLDVAQDVTVRVVDGTTVTLGARLAQYQFDRDVVFLSAGARHYFRGGSVGYRLTHVDPDNRDAFLSHLVDLSLRDGAGSAGQTRLWLSTGAATVALSDLDRNPSGQDRGAALQRIQPLGDRLSLVALAGVSSYARTAGRVTGTNLGLGLSIGGR